MHGLLHAGHAGVLARCPCTGTCCRTGWTLKRARLGIATATDDSSSQHSMCLATPSVQSCAQLIFSVIHKSASTPLCRSAVPCAALSTVPCLTVSCAAPPTGQGSRGPSSTPCWPLHRLSQGHGRCLLPASRDSSTMDMHACMPGCLLQASQPRQQDGHTRSRMGTPRLHDAAGYVCMPAMQQQQQLLMLLRWVLDEALCLRQATVQTICYSSSLGHQSAAACCSRSFLCPPFNSCCHILLHFPAVALPAS
jgi:hypothetical protein